MKKIILIIAGGTGGHVMPGLSIATQLQAQGLSVHWMGTWAGLENKLVNAQKIPMSYIDIQGLRGKGILGWLFAPIRIVKALYQSIKIMIKLKPHAVISMGGYVSGPGGLAAWLCHRPLLIHEQNAVAGLTNRLLAPFAQTIMTGFPNVLKNGKQTGNPVRSNIKPVPKVSPSKPLRVLVVGGSLGAQIFNQIMPEALLALPIAERPEIWHQTGAKRLDYTRERYEKYGIIAKIEPFIDDMASAYAWADCVICRAGALTIAELAAAGLASVLVPLPSAVDDHQTENAKYLTQNGAAILIPQSELSIDKLVMILQNFSEYPQKLREMALKANALAKPHATQEVVNYCIENTREY